jgi:hypothetical protein
MTIIEVTDANLRHDQETVRVILRAESGEKRTTQLLKDNPKIDTSGRTVQQLKDKPRRTLTHQDASHHAQIRMGRHSTASSKRNNRQTLNELKSKNQVES